MAFVHIVSFVNLKKSLKRNFTVLPPPLLVTNTLINLEAMYKISVFLLIRFYYQKNEAFFHSCTVNEGHFWKKKQSIYATLYSIHIDRVCMD